MQAGGEEKRPVLRGVRDCAVLRGVSVYWPLIGRCAYLLGNIWVRDQRAPLRAGDLGLLEIKQLAQKTFAALFAVAAAVIIIVVIPAAGAVLVVSLGGARGFGLVEGL